jgi:hypothetical protein
VTHSLMIYLTNEICCCMVNSIYAVYGLDAFYALMLLFLLRPPMKWEIVVLVILQFFPQ